MSRREIDEEHARWERLQAEGHVRRTRCPEFTTMQIIAANTVQSQLTPGSGPVPHILSLCTCGVIRITPLGGGA